MTLVAALLAAGGVEAGGLDARDELALDAALADRAVPGPLLTAARWGLFSSLPLSYLPWDGWGVADRRATPQRPTVRRVPDRSGADAQATLEGLDLDAALAGQAVPGSLLAAAEWGLFSSHSLSYLPWDGWAVAKRRATPERPTVRRVPDRSGADAQATLEGLDLDAALAGQAVPGPLLAAAEWGLFSSHSLSYVPRDGWAVAKRRATPERPTVRRVPDRSGAGPVEVGGDEWSRYEYIDTFREPWHREDATIEGLSCVRWDRAASRLELRGSSHQRRVSLVYHFVSPYTMKDIAAELTGEIEGGVSDRVELALSLDGEEFGHAVGAFGREGGNRFLLTTNACTRYHRCGLWVRVSGELSPGARVRLSSFRMAGRVKPPGRPEVALAASGEDRLRYRDDFRSRKLFHLAEIQNADALGWHRGRIFVRRGKEAVRVEVRQKFLSPEPLREIAVQIHNAAKGPGGNQFALSLDGRTLLAVASTPKSGDGFDGTTELRLSDARIANARHFYLHMLLASDASEAAETASLVSCVEVEARAAQPTAATAAVTRDPAVRRE